MPTSNGFLVPYPPTLFPPSEKQAFSGSTNSFSSSSSSSASANYFDRLSRASSASAYMSDITPPITPTNSNFDVELKAGHTTSSGPFPDERSLQEHLAAEHFSSSLLRPITTLEDDGGYRSDSEEDSGALDAVANFRSRLLKSKQTSNSRRALRIIESRSKPELDLAGGDEVIPTPADVVPQVEEQFVLPHDWENVFDRGMVAIWQEFREVVYGFNPEESRPANLPIFDGHKSRSEVRLHDFPIFDLDPGVGHQLGQDNIPRGMVFERLPPTPKMPAKPVLRPVELSDWDVSSFSLADPPSISMSVLPPIQAQHNTDVIPSSPVMINEPSLSLCDSPSFESSASISMSLLSPVQHDTSVIASSPAIFNESFAHVNVPLMSPPTAISRLIFAARPERRSFPVALTGENLDLASIIRLEVAASNHRTQPGHRNEPHPVRELGFDMQPQHHLPPSHFISYPSFYDHSFDNAMPESMSHQQFMIIASSFAQESTPAQHHHEQELEPDLVLHGDFLQVRDVPKSPLPSDPSQPLVGLGLGVLVEGCIRSSASISKLDDDPVVSAPEPDMHMVDAHYDDDSSPRVDVTVSECNAEIEPPGVLSRLQSLQSRISTSLWAHRDHQEGLADPYVDYNVHQGRVSEHRQPSSPLDKAYLADDESEVEPSGVLSGSLSPSHDRTNLGPSTSHHLIDPALYRPNTSIGGAFECGVDPGTEPYGALPGSETSPQRSFADSVSSSRQNHIKSRKRLPHPFRAPPVIAATRSSETPPLPSVPRLFHNHVADQIHITLEDIVAPSVLATTCFPPTHPSDSIHTVSDAAVRQSLSLAPENAPSDLLWTAPQTPGQVPPPINIVQYGPEHSAFLSRVSPLHHLAQSLKSDDYLARSRANLALPASSSSSVLQDLDISSLGLSSFVLTPGNDPRSPCSPSVAYFHPESYVLGSQGVLPADNLSPDHVTQPPQSSFTSHSFGLSSSSSGLLGESRSMEGLGIGLPSGLLVTSQSTMSTSEECQNLAQLASAPSPNVEDLGNTSSSEGDSSPQPVGVSPRLFFKVPKFAKRRLYDIPEQPTPSPTLSAHRLRTPTPGNQQRQRSRSRWSGLSLLKRLCSSSRLSWLPFPTNLKEASSVSNSGDGSSEDEEHIGAVSPVDHDSCPPPPRDDVPVFSATKSTNVLRRCFNKITRSAISAPFLSSPPLPTNAVSPGVIEYDDVPQPSLGIFKSLSEGRLAPISKKLQVLF